MDKNSRVIGNRLQNGAFTSEQVGAYNIYKGARYVPKIMGQWDANVNYEPLSIVINQGNSYTSAQYVPAGVPLSNNGPYWFQTGNFNGQISALGEQVEINKTEITDLKNKTLKTKPLLMGDSFGSGFVEGSGANPQYGWANYINQYLSDYYIQVNSGAGFIGTGALTFSQLLDNVTANDVGEIYVQTAGNDYSFTYEQQVEAINQFATKAFAKFPLLDKIYLIYNVNSGTALLGKSSEIITNIKNNPLLNPNVVVGENFQIIAHNLKYYNPIDGFHPSIDGAKEIALSIANYVKSKNFGFQKRRVGIYTANFGCDIVTCETGLLISGSSPWTPGTYNSNGYYVLNNLTYGTDCPIIRGNYLIMQGVVISNWQVRQYGIMRVLNSELHFVTSELSDTSNIHLLYSGFYPYNDLSA